MEIITTILTYASYGLLIYGGVYSLKAYQEYKNNKKGE